METITSRTNPLCTHLRKLASSGSYRRERREFLCRQSKAAGGGSCLWRQLADCGMYGTDGAAVCPRWRPAGGRAGDVMKSISPAQTPQGVLCVCKMPESALPERLTGRRYVVLDGVQDPGNVGTILRTADAFGADGVFLVNGCADLYNPKTVRATMGAIFRCRLAPAAWRRFWSCWWGFHCTAPRCDLTRRTCARWITAAAP